VASVQAFMRDEYGYIASQLPCPSLIGVALANPPAA
jgi:hypothetical protein